MERFDRRLLNYERWHVNPSQVFVLIGFGKRFDAGKQQEIRTTFPEAKTIPARLPRLWRQSDCNRRTELRGF